MNVSIGFSCIKMSEEPSPVAIQFSMYESMSKSSTGGAHVKMILRPSEVPVKFVGGPEGAMFLLEE